MVRIKDESCSAAACAREDISQNILGPLQTYFKAIADVFSKRHVNKLAKQSIQFIL